MKTTTSTTSTRYPWGSETPGPRLRAACARARTGIEQVQAPGTHRQIADRTWRARATPEPTVALLRAPPATTPEPRPAPTAVRVDALEGDELDLDELKRMLIADHRGPYGAASVSAAPLGVMPNPVMQAYRRLRDALGTRETEELVLDAADASSTEPSEHAPVRERRRHRAPSGRTASAPTGHGPLDWFARLIGTRKQHDGSDLVEDALRVLLRAVLGSQPAPAPSATEEQPARIGTTIAQRERELERQAHIDARDRPKPQTPEPNAPSAATPTPKAPSPATAPPSAPATPDPLSAAIRTIARAYLHSDDRRWRNARSAEQLESVVAEALAEHPVVAPPEARPVVAKRVATRLRSYAGDRYGLDPITYEPQRRPTRYDREFREDYTAAGGWPAWHAETMPIWIADREPQLISECRHAISRARALGSIGRSGAHQPGPAQTPEQGQGGPGPDRR